MKREQAPKWKADALTAVEKAISEHPVVAIVNVGGITGPPMQTMRKNLRGDVAIQVAKKNLIELAIKSQAKDKPGLEQLIPLMNGQSAVIAAKMNPFKLYRILELAKTKAAAKGGEIAPEDIEVRAGETPFKPGPIVGELQKAGIPAAIAEGKVIIKSDKTLVKAGDRIPAALAPVLAKLEIFPLTVGVDLKAVYEDGTIYTGSVLAIDPVQYQNNVRLAAAGSLAVALEIGYATKYTIKPMIAKAARGAMAVALETGTITKDTAGPVLGKAFREMLAVASKVPDALDEDLKKTLG